MKFWKYQGAGNDFIMLDQREDQLISQADTELIEHLCDRRFGIGADGLILLQALSGYDFQMIYFNADGKESTMCGNGGRCVAAFAQNLGFISQKCRFMAIDGEHEAIISPLHGVDGPGYWVELKMSDVKDIERQEDAFIMNTGSPHFVRFLDNLENVDVVAEGRAIRYSEPWKNDGINVNFIGQGEKSNQLQIRTYERGVEDETYACGTGVTAAAIASFLKSGSQAEDAEVKVQAKGGDLRVRFHVNENGTFSDIWLCGPAVGVFEGKIKVDLNHFMA